jgi:hypothetical protein
MTNEELITIARSHAADIPKDSGASWASLETLTKMTTLDALIVYFEADQRPQRIIVVVAKESGKFLFSGLVPRNAP